MKSFTTDGSASILDRLLEAIIDEGRHIPKFQVERAISPFVGLFLADVLSVLSGHKVVLLAAEFPLVKPPVPPKKTLRSTNIDWLAYDTTSNTLLLVELKTARESVRDSQMENYRTYLQRSSQEPRWPKLRGDLDRIHVVSKRRLKYQKYREQLDRRITELEAMFRKGKLDTAEVEIVVLGPKRTVHLTPSAGERHYSFGDIRDAMTRAYTREANREMFAVLDKLATLDLD